MPFLNKATCIKKNGCYCSRATIVRGVFVPLARKFRDNRREMRQNEVFLCIAKRVAVNAVNSNKWMPLFAQGMAAKGRGCAFHE